MEQCCNGEELATRPSYGAWLHHLARFCKKVESFLFPIDKRVPRRLGVSGCLHPDAPPQTTLSQVFAYRISGAKARSIQACYLRTSSTYQAAREGRKYSSRKDRSRPAAELQRWHFESSIPAPNRAPCPGRSPVSDKKSP